MCCRSIHESPTSVFTTPTKAVSLYLSLVSLLFRPIFLPYTSTASSEGILLRGRDLASVRVGTTTVCWGGLLSWSSWNLQYGKVSTYDHCPHNVSFLDSSRCLWVRLRPTCAIFPTLLFPYLSLTHIHRSPAPSACKASRLYHRVVVVRCLPLRPEAIADVPQLLLRRDPVAAQAVSEEPFCKEV